MKVLIQLLVNQIKNLNESNFASDESNEENHINSTKITKYFFSKQSFQEPTSRLVFERCDLKKDDDLFIELTPRSGKKKEEFQIKDEILFKKEENDHKKTHIFQRKSKKLPFKNQNLKIDSSMIKFLSNKLIGDKFFDYFLQMKYFIFGMFNERLQPKFIDAKVNNSNGIFIFF